MTAKDTEAEAEAAMRTIVLAGIRSGKSDRDIAVDLHGADRVAADWHVDGWMRAQVRRLVRRARDVSDEGSDNAGLGTP